MEVVYRSLNREEAQDYEVVKAAILYHLELSPEHFQRLFRAHKAPEETRPWVLLQRLHDLFGKWVKLLACTMVALVDKIILEQFVNDLEDRTQQCVQQHALEMCEEALKVVEDFADSECQWHKEGFHHNVQPNLTSQFKLCYHAPTYYHLGTIYIKQGWAKCGP
uniref:SCAN box domain-containing protein n=1 Tax=Crocodylus porosus TaxID=8502 RepID=A0A7M4F625_CROPO